MQVDLSNIKGLAGRGGKSPERNHEYECPSCDNETFFIGVDDYGQPGKGYECPRCGGVAGGSEPNRCWCPAFPTFRQPFRAQKPGQTPMYESSEGPGASGGTTHV